MDMDSLVLAARTALALACVLGLIWVVARKAGWGKGGRRATGPAIEVVGRQALGRHAGVAVLAVGERRLLVGFGEQQITMLTELDPVAAEVEPAAAEPVRSAKPLFSWRRTESFESALAGAMAESEPAAPATPAVAPVAPAAAALAAANSALATAARLNAVTAVPTQPSPGEHTTVPGLAGARVADIDPTDLAPAAEPAAVNAGPLDGSILAPSTWKQAVSALRERTVRR